MTNITPYFYWLYNKLNKIVFTKHCYYVIIIIYGNKRLKSVIWL